MAFRTAAHCDTLQHTATHCNTLQHTTTRHSMAFVCEPNIQNTHENANVWWLSGVDVRLCNLVGKHIYLYLYIPVHIHMFTQCCTLHTSEPPPPQEKKKVSTYHSQVDSVGYKYVMSHRIIVIPFVTQRIRVWVMSHTQIVVAISGFCWIIWRTAQNIFFLSEQYGRKLCVYDYVSHQFFLTEQCAKLGRVSWLSPPHVFPWLGSAQKDTQKHSNNFECRLCRLCAAGIFVTQS